MRRNISSSLAPNFLRSRRRGGEIDSGSDIDRSGIDRDSCASGIELELEVEVEFGEISFEVDFGSEIERLDELDEFGVEFVTYSESVGACGLTLSASGTWWTNLLRREPSTATPLLVL